MESDAVSSRFNVPRFDVKNGDIKKYLQKIIGLRPNDLEILDFGPIGEEMDLDIYSVRITASLVLGTISDPFWENALDKIVEKFDQYDFSGRSTVRIRAQFADPFKTKTKISLKTDFKSMVTWKKLRGEIKARLETIRKGLLEQSHPAKLWMVTLFADGLSDDSSYLHVA